MVIDSLVNHVQFAFVKGRQILDGPLMMNEIIQWYKRKTNNLMVLKVDFDKAYDFVIWDYLLQVMYFMGFDQKWIQWIIVCLVYSRTSVLVNGFPTKEFSPQIGLR